MHISLVLAIATDDTIGNSGKMPWHLRSDLARFKEITRGGTVIMGRKTWDSILKKYRPLSDRQNIVLTHGPGDDVVQEGGVVAASMPHALSLARRNTYVIGGAQIYTLFLPMAQRAYVTRVYGDFGGDTRLSEELFSRGDGWSLVSDQEFKTTARGLHHPGDSHESEFHVFARKLMPTQNARE